MTDTNEAKPAEQPKAPDRPKRPTKTQRDALDELQRVVWWLDRQEHLDTYIRTQVPDAWHRLCFDHETFEKKEKVTLYLDRSVARAFRAMGLGYQARINALLRSWLAMKAAGFIETEKAIWERFRELGVEDKMRAMAAKAGIEGWWERAPDDPPPAPERPAA
jgi:uncharacterized protein (DUF4415 family)